MACQPLHGTSENLDCIEIQSFIRDYRTYKDNWSPVVGKVLLVKSESTNNPKDNNAVAVYKDDLVVGRLLHLIIYYHTSSDFWHNMSMV